MRPPHLDHVGVFCAQALQRAAKLSRRRKHMILRRDQRRNVHRRWERIVGALGFVHVVVGVHELFAQQRVEQGLAQPEDPNMAENAEIPETGDSGVIALGVLAGGSMLAIGAAVLLKKRKNSEV